MQGAELAAALRAPVLSAALRGAALFVPSGISFCPGSKGSKEAWTSWGELSWHNLSSRRLILEEPSKSLKILYEEWNLKGFCPNPNSAAVLLLLEYSACSSAALEV